MFFFDYVKNWKELVRREQERSPTEGMQILLVRIETTYVIFIYVYI